MAEQDEKPKLTLEKGESVYSYAIFLPPIVHHRRGSLYNYEMCLGIILLLMNLTMQIGLTYVVGSGVIEEGNAWRYSLVGIGVDDQVVEGQVATDAEQEVSLFSNRSSMLKGAFLGDGPKSVETDVNSVAEEMEMEVGLTKRSDHDTQLIEIEELESKLEEEESSVEELKAQNARKRGGKQSTALRASLAPATTKITGGDVNLVVAQKPMGGAAAAAKGKGDAAGSAYFCHMSNATYTCLPPSVKYAAVWEQLDTNGDGVWSREEAEKDENKLEKKFKAKAFLVFRAITVGLVDRQTVDTRLWVPPQVAKMEGIPKAYFDYWMGDAALCSYADMQMCPTLLARGFFSEAINPEHHGKEITDIDGALDYCIFMLKVGGGCDQSLPQIYKLYRTTRHEQCGDNQLYPAGLFRSPYHPTDRVYIIANAYSNLSKYIKSDSLVYKCFLFLVLLLWLLALVGELREMVKLAEFTATFPSAEGSGLEVEKNDDGDEQYTITGISREHRMVIGFMCILRTVVVVYLGSVGCTFLVLETGYMDLLMNAVALAFVLEVDEILFGAIARISTVEELEALSDLEFETSLPTIGCAGWILQKDFWGIVAFPIIAYLLILSHSLFVTKPVLDALNCGCYQLGKQCEDAQYYDKDWWDFYWSQTLPNAIAKMAEFKQAAGAL